MPEDRTGRAVVLRQEASVTTRCVRPAWRDAMLCGARAVSQFDFQLQQEPWIRTVGVAAHGHQTAGIPTFAQRCGQHIFARAQTFRHVEGLILNALAVAGPFGGEQLVAHSLAVEAQFIKSAGARIDGRALDCFSHAKGFRTIVAGKASDALPGCNVTSAPSVRLALAHAPVSIESKADTGAPWARSFRCPLAPRSVLPARAAGATPAFPRGPGRNDRDHAPAGGDGQRTHCAVVEGN